MEEYKVKQIQPNHADHISYYKESYLTKMLNEELVVSQPKYDGERMLMHLNNGEVYCTSRRISKKTQHFNEMQDRLPIFSSLKVDLGYTVLDGECYSKDWSSVVGVLHSLPERATELLKTTTVKYAVFDCLFYDGQDIRNLPYYKRYLYAMAVVEMLNYPLVHIVQSTQIYYNSDFNFMMNKFISEGFEGTVIKSFNRRYYDKGASLKVKKFETLDVVVIDYQQGTGKYSNTIGALIIGYYDDEHHCFERIGKVNCGTDADRDFWRDNWNRLKYSVLEVKCQEITKKSLRHPVYLRLRDDKSYNMCTRDTIFKEEE